ncbi:sugar transferase [Flavitalea sp.]|nr:sugar transferase [Flavitalea sp.]
MVRTENNVSPKRVYAYRRTTAAPEKKPILPNLSYLYIGNKFKAAHDLHAGFENSYFLFSFDETIKLLFRLEKAGRLPSVILVDSPKDISAFKKFLEALSEVESFKTVTILAEVSNCRQEIIAQLSQEKGISDLVMINTNNGLAEKVVFFNKLQKGALLAEKSLHQGINWNMIKHYGFVRVFDLIFSMICIVLLSPLMLLLGVLVKMDGGSNILEFSIERGLRYRSFRYIRFRTELSYSNEQFPDLCHVNQFLNSENDGASYQGKSNQTSKIGAFLRSTNLDELPALFNIMAGDISFIRNR